MMDEAAKVMAMPVLDDPVSSAFRAYRAALAARHEAPGRIERMGLDCRARIGEPRRDQEGVGGAGGAGGVGGVGGVGGLRTAC